MTDEVDRRDERACGSDGMRRTRLSSRNPARVRAPWCPRRLGRRARRGEVEVCCEIGDFTRFAKPASLLASEIRLPS
jgi:hypothetical protein